MNNSRAIASLLTVCLALSSLAACAPAKTEDTSSSSAAEYLKEVGRMPESLIIGGADEEYVL